MCNIPNPLSACTPSTPENCERANVSRASSRPTHDLSRRIQRTALAPIQNGVRKFLGAFSTAKPAKTETEKPIDIVKGVTSLGITSSAAINAPVRSVGKVSINDVPAKLFLRFLPFAEHLKARAVCKQWKGASNDMGMAPPDADHAWVLEEDVRWSQEIIETQMERESQIWDSAFCSSMTNMLSVSAADSSAAAVASPLTMAYYPTDPERNDCKHAPGAGRLDY